MTSATLSLPTTTTVEAAPRKQNFFARALNAVIEARMRQAEREMARYRHLIPQLQISKTD